MPGHRAQIKLWALADVKFPYPQYCHQVSQLLYGRMSFALIWTWLTSSLSKRLVTSIETKSPASLSPMRPGRPPHHRTQERRPHRRGSQTPSLPRLSHVAPPPGRPPPKAHCRRENEPEFLLLSRPQTLRHDLTRAILHLLSHSTLSDARRQIMGRMRNAQTL